MIDRVDENRLAAGRVAASSGADQTGRQKSGGESDGGRDVVGKHIGTLPHSRRPTCFGTKRRRSRAVYDAGSECSEFALHRDCKYGVEFPNDLIVPLPMSTGETLGLTSWPFYALVALLGLCLARTQASRPDDEFVQSE